MRYTLFTILILSAGQLPAATKETITGEPALWPALIVLCTSFLLGVISFLSVDRMLDDGEKPAAPGEEAYIEQMLVANGAHLNLDGDPAACID